MLKVPLRASRARLRAAKLSLISARCKTISLGIESTFDDSAVGIVTCEGQILADERLRQNHTKTGGTVPLTAARMHQDNLPKLLDAALAKAELTVDDIDCVSCAIGPGLAPCLEAGIEFATSYSRRHQLPFVGVNHMEAHALTGTLTDKDAKLPSLALLASGGHCLLLVVNGPGDIWRLGTCLDDAPGEAYDKLARAFEVASPSDMERLALKGDARKHRFGNMLASQRTCDFSFSGLKTKVLRVAQEPGVQLEDVVAGFQQAVIDHLTTRCERAVKFCQQKGLHLNGFAAAGGVLSNKAIRTELETLAQAHNLPVTYPPPHLCVDNGVMIAWAGLQHYKQGTCTVRGTLDNIRFHPRWPLGMDMSRQVLMADIAVGRRRR
eukprot:TRINITY_DN10612_c0_g1_i5.p1 TRINITY_DN10612_c0_g1~~TRINITY_DN10612_c0_g1_i5.p1  ORF type:complete len:380 (+),score=62.40 TRINITY_DN10612_c0_g1_i5:92-1231(+)